MENTIYLPTNLWQYNRTLIKGYYGSSEEKAVEGIIAQYKLYYPQSESYRPVEKLVERYDKDFIAKRNRVELLNIFYSLPIIAKTAITNRKNIKNAIMTLNSDNQRIFQFERLLYSKYKNELISFLKETEHSSSITEERIKEFVGVVKNKEHLSEKERGLSLLSRIFILWINNPNASYFGGNSMPEICRSLSKTLESEIGYTKETYSNFNKIFIQKTAGINKWDGVKSYIKEARALMNTPNDLNMFDQAFNLIENHYEGLRK